MTNIRKKNELPFNMLFLLNQVNQLNKKYEGENFNVFRILGLSRKELIHSLFISNLLNPQGSHGQGEKFLKLFLNEVNIEFNPNKAVVKKEVNIKKIDPESDSIGRIDIVISEHKSNQRVFIENKIDAKDQKKQLYRYSKCKNNPRLIYLTLFGHHASKDSLDILKPEDYERISYRETILNWLEKCLEETTDSPLLKATIIQYILLLKKLTGKPMNEQMEKELFDALIKNTESAFFIAKNIDQLKSQIVARAISSIEEKFCMKSYIKTNRKLYEAHGGFGFKNEDWQYLKIEFKFSKSQLQGLIFGFCPKDTNIAIPEETKKTLGKYGNTNSTWPLFKDIEEEYRDWNDDFFIMLSNLESEEAKDFLSMIEEKIHYLLKISDGLEL